MYQGSLVSAFEPSPDIAKVAANAGPEPSTSATATPAASTESTDAQIVAEGAGAGDNEAWKDEYERHLAHWKEESARARKKAEKTREMYEKRREEERNAGKTGDSESVKAEEKVEEKDAVLVTNRYVHQYLLEGWYFNAKW